MLMIMLMRWYTTTFCVFFLHPFILAIQKPCFIFLKSNKACLMRVCVSLSSLFKRIKCDDNNYTQLQKKIYTHSKKKIIKRSSSSIYFIWCHGMKKKKWNINKKTTIQLNDNLWSLKYSGVLNKEFFFCQSP